MRLFPVYLSLCISSVALAEIRLPSFFSDGMVLQRETEASIWGWSEAGAKATVNFAGQTESVTTDKDGAWRVSFKGLETNKKGSALTISVGSEEKVIKDVLVGEVWIASGQSNMEWKMSQTGSKSYAETVSNPLVRQYVCTNVAIDEPQEDLKGQWEDATEGKTSHFSAVGYHFAESIQKALDIPVGVIEMSWGGKPVQAFISEEKVNALPEAKGLVAQQAAVLKNYNPTKAKEAHQKRLVKYKTTFKEWVAAGSKGKKPKRPNLGVHPALNPSAPSTIFNGIIHPFIGYGVRGAIWYQGESNSGHPIAYGYGEMLECMVDDWRTRWDNPFSFYYAQLSSYKEAPTEPGTKSGWVTIQDEMRRALKTIPKSGMAVITDIGNVKTVHPSNKKDVGERLARWALAHDYGQSDLIFSGPLYQETRFNEGKATVSFEHANGLKTRDGQKVAMFELAGEDGQWVWADAKIEGNTVEVTAPSVSKATKVRYAWAQNASAANLINAEGLPASCFTSEAEVE